MFSFRTPRNCKYKMCEIQLFQSWLSSVLKGLHDPKFYFTVWSRPPSLLWHLHCVSFHSLTIRLNDDTNLRDLKSFPIRSPGSTTYDTLTALFFFLFYLARISFQRSTFFFLNDLMREKNFLLSWNCVSECRSTEVYSTHAGNGEARIDSDITTWCILLITILSPVP